MEYEIYITRDQCTEAFLQIQHISAGDSLSANGNGMNLRGVFVRNQTRFSTEGKQSRAAEISSVALAEWRLTKGLTDRSHQRPYDPNCFVEISITYSQNFLVISAVGHVGLPIYPADRSYPVDLE